MFSDVLINIVKNVIKAQTKLLRLMHGLAQQLYSLLSFSLKNKLNWEYAGLASNLNDYGLQQNLKQTIVGLQSHKLSKVSCSEQAAM